MREEVTLGFAHPLSILHSSHVVAESAARRVLRHQGVLCFLFVAHGALDLHHEGRHVALSADEALLFASAGHGPPVLSCGGGTEFYVLQFTHGCPAAGVPQRTLDVPDHVAFRSSARMKHLVRMFM